MADIQSPAAEIRREKKERRKHGQKYNGLPYSIGQTIIKTPVTRTVLAVWGLESRRYERWWC